jgi:hypothetical protein
MARIRLREAYGLGRANGESRLISAFWGLVFWVCRYERL